MKLTPRPNANLKRKRPPILRVKMNRSPRWRTITKRKNVKLGKVPRKTTMIKVHLEVVPMSTNREANLQSRELKVFFIEKFLFD